MMRKDNTGQLYFVSYVASEGNDRQKGVFSGYRPGAVPPAMVPDIVRAQNLLEKYADKLIEHGKSLAAEQLEAVLRANGLNAQAISGDVPQKKRLRFLRDFHIGDLAVLIATDVASRGLHIPDVSHVFNFDLPQDVADYVHRIGRTGRAEAVGVIIERRAPQAD